MKKLKRIAAVVLSLSLVLSLAGCQKIEPQPSAGSAPAQSTSVSSSSSEASPEQVPADWATQVGLHLDEPMEELYKKALEEGGEVVIYTISSRMEKVKAMFEEDYPGMTLTPYDI